MNATPFECGLPGPRRLVGAESWYVGVGEAREGEGRGGLGGAVVQRPGGQVWAGCCALRNWAADTYIMKEHAQRCERTRAVALVPDDIEESTVVRNLAIHSDEKAQQLAAGRALLR